MVADMKVDMVADMVVNKMADMLANMKVDKVADMKVDKDMVANMVADMSCFNLVRGLVAGAGPKLFPTPRLRTRLACLLSFASLF